MKLYDTILIHMQSAITVKTQGVRGLLGSDSPKYARMKYAN